jgi:peptide deformylase
MEILLYGDDRLTQKCQPVSVITLAMHQTIQEMFDLMYQSHGIGLAAPQVGIQERFFIADIRDGKQYVFINPEIIEKKKPVIMDEGCLSFPGVFTEVKRFEKIKVKAQDLAGQEFILEAEDLLAQVIQHETDHLDGILLNDVTIEKAEFQLKLLDLGN